MLPHPVPGESAEEHAGTHAASLDPPKKRGTYVHVLSATNQELSDIDINSHSVQSNIKQP